MRSRWRAGTFVAGAALVAGASIGLAGSAGAQPATDWSKPFTRPQYLLHTTDVGGSAHEELFLYPRQPDDNGLVQSDDLFGGQATTVDFWTGPYKTPGAFCSAALGDPHLTSRLNGEVDLWSEWMDTSGNTFSCSAFSAYRKKAAGSGFFGAVGVILVGLGVKLGLTAGGVATGGLGIVAGAVAYYIWTRGAPAPIRRDPVFTKMVEIAKTQAKTATAKLETASLGGLTPDEAAELIGAKDYLVHLSPKEKQQFYRESGVPVQRLIDAVKDYNALPDAEK